MGKKKYLDVASEPPEVEEGSNEKKEVKKKNKKRKLTKLASPEPEHEIEIIPVKKRKKKKEEKEKETLLDPIEVPSDSFDSGSIEPSAPVEEPSPPMEETPPEEELEGKKPSKKKLKEDLARANMKIEELEKELGAAKASIEFHSTKETVKDEVLEDELEILFSGSKEEAKKNELAEGRLKKATAKIASLKEELAAGKEREEDLSRRLEEKSQIQEKFVDLSKVKIEQSDELYEKTTELAKMNRLYDGACREARKEQLRAEQAEKNLAESEAMLINDRRFIDQLQITIRDQYIEMENLKEQLTAASRPPPDPISLKVEKVKNEMMTTERAEIDELEKELESVKEINKQIMNTSIGKATKEMEELKEKIGRLAEEVEEVKRRNVSLELEKYEMKCESQAKENAEASERIKNDGILLQRDIFVRQNRELRARVEFYEKKGNWQGQASLPPLPPCLPYPLPLVFMDALSPSVTTPSQCPSMASPSVHHFNPSIPPPSLLSNPKMTGEIPGADSNDK